MHARLFLRKSIIVSVEDHNRARSKPMMIMATTKEEGMTTAPTIAPIARAIRPMFAMTAESFVTKTMKSLPAIDIGLTTGMKQALEDPMNS